MTIVERTAIAASSSGKAGGFLAQSWGDGTSTQQLHRVSFDLHRELAAELGVESYRQIKVLSVQTETGGEAKGAPGWLDGDVRASVMDASGGAQVTPRELTEKLFAGSGADLVVGAARGLRLAEDGTCEGVVVRREGSDGEEVVPCASVVVAMGVWSTLLEDWVGGRTGLRVPMEGVKSTSVVFEGSAAVAEEPSALFCSEDSNGCHLEVYPRPDGSVYLCGIGGSDYVSGARLRDGGDCERAELVREDPARVAAATASFTRMAPAATGGKAPVTVQACMRPCPPDARPLIGTVPGTKNVVIAAGHNCWGILWAPVTGKVVSEIVSGERPSVDLSAFSPDRFMPAQARGTRGRKMGATPTGEQW